MAPPPTGQRKLELLAPARDLACGLAALQHGADAVYIGGPHFSARAAAANSLSDIETLVTAAHQLRARVYVALNTLFDDEELPHAAKLAGQLHDLGVDALIIQDLGLLECELPPIPLHASTQLNNREPAKVAFLEQVGFLQVVLARELSLEQIRAIRAATTIALEFFVHGALCVSYSGQCYLSEVVAGRSANRGQCAQLCRHRYTLREGQGRVLAHDRYLLSLKDLNLAHWLGELVAAGIDSFKIEGRLKDPGYVKNVTAYYRQALDRVIEARADLDRSSSGRCRFSFDPDPARSFSRGQTDYFLTRQINTPGAIDSPKSIGKQLGPVVFAGRQSFSLQTAEVISHGDGLCYFDAAGELVGLKVNRVAGGKIYPREPVCLPLGTIVYRNADTAFSRRLAISDHCRTLAVRLHLQEVADGLQLTVVDEDGLSSETHLALEKGSTGKAGSAAALAARQLGKCGGTLFRAEEIRVELSPAVAFPAAAYNELRRQALAHQLEVRRQRYPLRRVRLEVNDVPWPGRAVSYLDNIANRRAEAFFLRHGVQTLDRSRLQAGQVAGCALMTTRYCLRAQLGCCPRLNRQAAQGEALPLVLSDRSREYDLVFDCYRCEMTVHQRLPRAG